MEHFRQKVDICKIYGINSSRQIGPTDNSSLRRGVQHRRRGQGLVLSTGTVDIDVGARAPSLNTNVRHSQPLDLF